MTFLNPLLRTQGSDDWLETRTSESTLMAVLDALDLNRPTIARLAMSLLAKRKGKERLVLRDLYDQYADGRIA